ncbi:hypothetical protein MCERE19_04016 [Spirosomataceae bacterium]|jgi:hypothetical protein
MKLLSKIFLLSTGLIFLFSGFSKAIDSQAFINKLWEYGFGYFGYLAPLVSSLEIYLGLSILLRYNVRISLFVGLILTSLFSIFFLFGNFFLGVKECGCFGEIIHLTTTETIIKNLFLIIGFTYLLKGKIESRANKPIQLLVLLVSAISFSLSGYTIDNSLVSTFTFNKLEGKSISETKLSNISMFSKDGNFTIFVYSPICDHCWNATANVKEINESKLFGDVIGVISTSKKDFLQDYEKSFTPNFKTVVIDKKTLLDTFGNGYPKLLIIRNGKIVKVYNNSEIPCVKILKSHLKII